MGFSKRENEVRDMVSGYRKEVKTKERKETKEARRKPKEGQDKCFEE